MLLKTAVLAQINSEDTRTLAVQEDILEKEFLEMQKVLLAMQVKFKMIIITDKQNSLIIFKLIPSMCCLLDGCLRGDEGCFHNLN